MGFRFWGLADKFGRETDVALKPRTDDPTTYDLSVTDTAMGAQSDAAWDGVASLASVVALLKGIFARNAAAVYTFPDGVAKMNIGSTRTLFSDDFGGTAIDPLRWDVLDGGQAAVSINGTGQAAIGGGSVGSITASVANSVLSIAMGTSAGSEKWFLSKKTFAGSEDITIVMSRSQALAANSFWVGMVEVDPATGYVVANPLTPGEFNNAGGLEFGKTTNAQQAQLEAIGDGSPARTVVNNSSFAPAAMTTMFESAMEFNSEDVIASALSVDSANPKGANVLRLSSQVPNDIKIYKLLIRAMNVAAPASSTTFNVSRVTLVDGTEVRAEVKSGRGDTVGQKGIAVNIAGGSNTIGYTRPGDLGSITVAAVAAAGGTLFTADTNTYGACSFTLPGTWVATVSFYASQDGSNYFPTNVTTGLGGQVSSTSSNGVYFYNGAHRYFRAIVSAYTSGTVTAAGVLRQPFPVPYGQAGSAQFVETSTPLAASAKYTGPTHDAGPTPCQWSSFSAFARQDVAGSFLNIEQSADGVNWTVTAFAVPGAQASTIVTSPIFARYCRVSYNASSTAPTVLNIMSQFGR